MNGWFVRCPVGFRSPRLGHGDESLAPLAISAFGPAGAICRMPLWHGPRFEPQVAGMSDVLENSQAARDAARAATDLLRAENAGAPYGELAELWAVKARADERVATLRRRIQPMQAPARGRPPRPVPEQGRTEDQQWMTSRS